MIDPNEAPLNTPLWCVFGSEFWPSMICCMINDPPFGGRAIWGYSVYKRSPGFRTLGQSVNDNPYTGDWVKENNAKFFITQDEALEEMRKRTTPKKSAIGTLKRKQ